jgi:hypothetical protein
MEPPCTRQAAPIPCLYFSSRVVLGVGPGVVARAAIAVVAAAVAVVATALAWTGAAAVMGEGTVYETSFAGALSAPEVL